MVEAERRAYADRAEYMGDPDFITDKTEMLISDKYLKDRWKNFQFRKATPSAEVGKIVNQPKESEQTTLIYHRQIWQCCFCNYHAQRTLRKQSSGKGGGYFLNNEMDDFSVKPGVPNMYGAVGGEANSIVLNKEC